MLVRVYVRDSERKKSLKSQVGLEESESLLLTTTMVVLSRYPGVLL